MEAKKLIIIPESRPLFAMQRRLMISRGPIMKPTPVPISAIGELLRQSGNDEVTIYEVVQNGTRYSKEVRLTLDNYTLPYDEIVNGKTVSASTEKTPLPVEPDIVEPEVTPAAENASDPEIPEVTELTNETAPEGVEVIENPYAGMSRKQRKAAMRAAKREEQNTQPTETSIEE